ncbi:MAG: endonuclease III [Hadesarchaea archaeon]|nr:endonuclease III [Hadesarchaea archaeon]
MALKSVTNRARAADDLKCKRRLMVAILNRLGAEFELWRRYTNDPFLLLVGTVLSQNTNWRNTRAAYNRLVAKFRTPEQLARSEVREIQKLIKPAGLYRMKSKRLKELARIVLERYHGNLSTLLQKPPEEARRELLSLPGIGYKTADVLLVFGAGRDVLPIDTHIFRISKRLGFAPSKANYEEVRFDLEELTPTGRRGEAHVLLIQHGRRYCLARNPLCDKCPINDLCPIGIRRVKHAQL